MTKIIGHRGAAGLALENTKASFLAALDYKIDALEVDVRRTKDGKLVILHDRHTGRVAKEKVSIGSKTLAELRQMALHDGHEIPTLEQVFSIVGGKTPIVIDIKDSGVADEIIRLLEAFPEVQAEFTSFHHGELKKLHAALPECPVLVLEHFSPFEIIHTAKRLHATGISLNMWLMNPLTYYLARRNDLELRVYTINHPLIVRFFQILYPDVAIYTDRPERFVGKH